MTPKELRAAAAVMLAAAEGENIQGRLRGTTIWRRYDGCGPGFNWLDFEYQVEPKPVEFWANEYANNSSYTGVYVGHRTREEATVAGTNEATRVAIHMREVTNED